MFVDAPPSWNEIANTEEFHSLTPNEKANVQRRWVFDRMNYDYDRGNEIDQKAMVKEFRKNGFEPTVINTGFKDFTDYRSYMEGQQAEGLQGNALKEALKPQLSFLENYFVSNNQRWGALGAGLVRPLEGITGLANMTLGNALKAATGAAMGIDKLNDAMHKAVKDMSYDVESDVIGGFMDGGFRGGVNAIVNSVLMEIPNTIVQIYSGGAMDKKWSLALMGTMAAGSKFNEIKDDPDLAEWQKYAIATTNGIIEGLTEMIDTIPFVKGMTSETKQKIFREAMRSKPVRTLLGQLFKTGVGEGFEELVGEGAQNITETLIRGDFKKFKDKEYWKDLGKSSVNAGISGGAMGMGMGGAGYAYNRHQDSQRTSRKAFEEILQIDKRKGEVLPDKYTAIENRRNAIDNYDFHGEPITRGDATDEQRMATLKERIKWYEKIRDQIEESEEKAEWDEYYNEWQEKLSALEEKQKQMLPPPVDENGNELGVEEVTEGDEQPTVTETVTMPVTNETVTETVTEKPAEPPQEEQKPAEPPKKAFMPQGNTTEERITSLVENQSANMKKAQHANGESAGEFVEVVMDIKAGGDIKTSSDPNYGKEGVTLQNRENGVERNNMIHRIMKSPIWSDFFGTEWTHKGAPIIGADGNAESGNTRLDALRRLYQEGKADEYRKMVEARAKELGISTEGMSMPGVVRVRVNELTDAERSDFVRRANSNEEMRGISKENQAQDDMEAFNQHEDELLALYKQPASDNAFVNASNQDFFNEFRQKVGSRSSDVDENGHFTEQFFERIRNTFIGALFRKLPNGRELVKKTLKANGISRIVNGLVTKVPALMKQGNTHPDYDLTKILGEALENLIAYRNEHELNPKLTPGDYAKQGTFLTNSGDMKTEEELKLPPMSKEVEEMFYNLEAISSMREMRELVNHYMEQVDRNTGNSRQATFNFGDEQEKLSREEIIKEMAGYVKKRQMEGGSAVDAYLENGTLEDAEVPLVEGSVIATDEKPKAKRSLVRKTDTEMQEAKAHADEIGKAAKDVANNLGYDVIVHDTDADLPTNVQDDLVAFGDGAVAEAWNDNGVIHLVASRLESSEMAVKKVLHEIVGHSGLAALFKGRNNDAWNNMVENLWEGHRADILERCKDYLDVFDVDTQAGRSELVEEWLARLAETKRKPMWWRTVKSRIRQLLRMLPGLHELAISDAEIEQMLADAATAARRAQEVEPAGKTGNRYSIVGRKGAERLGIGGLQEAERMENNGESRESIWKNTGWWRGLDGEWRVELPNTKIDEDEWFKFRNRVFLDGERISLDDWYKKNNFQWRSVADNGRQFDLVRQWEKNLGKSYPTLADILPEVTKNYPELADVNIRPYKPYAGNSFWIVQDDDGTLGGLSDDGKSLFIARRADQNVLFHEVQHLIQHVEGFARGANITEFENQTVDNKKVKSAALRFADTFRKWEKLGLDKNELARYTDEYFNNEMYYSDKTTKRVVGDILDLPFDVTKSLYRSIRESLRMADWEANKFDEIVRDWRNEMRSPFEKYQATTGEVEARVVEKRLEMSPEERAARPPWEDFDVAERDQIVLKEKDKHIRYSVVKEGTQPLPSGPEPSISSILQRAAKSPIDVNHLHALRLPLIHELAKQLGGNVKTVDRINIMKGTARGVFYEGPERLIKVIRSLVAPHQLGHPIIAKNDMVEEQIETIKEYWKGRGIQEDEIEIIENEVEDQPTKTKIVTIWHDKSQAMLRKTLAHEVGHLIDYNAGETTSHGNVLGAVGGIVKGYLKHVIAEDPKNPIDWKVFEKRKRELHKQAEQAMGPRPADADARKEWRRKVKDEYSRLLADECDSNGMFRVAVIKDELVQNSAWWRGEWGEDDPNYARYREAPTELFADAMSVLLNAPDKFMEQLPETWRMLQNYQSQREDFHKAWQGMMRLMENEDVYAETLLNMAKMGYAADEKTVIQINKEKASFWRAMKRKYVDSFAEINDASKRMLRSGEAEWDDVPMPAITAAQHQSIKDYYLILAERLAKPLEKAGITDEQIGQYLENQRIVNDPSINQGHIINPHGLDVHSAELNLEKLHKDLGEEKWEALEDWHKEFWKLRKETIVKMIEQSGMYSKELVQHIKENEWYSYRAVIDQIYNADGTEKPGVGKIYGLKGTFSPIGNPLGWTYDHDLRLMSGILWNVARRDTIEFMKKHYPMLVQKVNAFSRSKNIVPAGYVRITVLEGNKSVDYNVAEAWALGFTSRLDTDTATMLRTFQGITNIYRRVWTMLSPTFLLNNLVRDYLASYQNLSGINRDIGVIEWTKCWLQGMKEAFSFNFENKWFGLTGQSDIIEEMMKSNMFQSGGKGYDMSERNGQETGSKRMELLRRYGMVNDEDRKNIVRRYADKIGDFIERMVDATEKGAKAGGFLALQRNNADMKDAERQWHIVRHIGSPDFAQRGTATPITNTIFIFSNAAMQGWNGTLEMAKANPKAFAARWMATTGTAVFIGWLLESGALRDALKGMGADDDDDTIKLLDWLQKMYGKITHYNRYNYMCLPLAERDDGYVWTLRLPFAENSKLPAMLMHGALDEAYTKIKKDKNLMNEIFDATLNQSPNVNPLGGLTRDVLFMLAGKNPRDFYRGREAVKSSEWDAGGMKRLWGSVKYLTHEYTPLPFVNQLFDLRDNPYWWWNIFGSITGMGAWFKPQLYGEAEQNKAVTAEKRRRKLSGKAEVFGGKKAQ